MSLDGCNLPRPLGLCFPVALGRLLFLAGVEPLAEILDGHDRLRLDHPPEAQQVQGVVQFARQLVREPVVEDGVQQRLVLTDEAQERTPPCRLVYISAVFVGVGIVALPFVLDDTDADTFPNTRFRATIS